MRFGYYHHNASLNLSVFPVYFNCNLFSVLICKICSNNYFLDSFQGGAYSIVSAKNVDGEASSSHPLSHPAYLHTHTHPHTHRSGHRLILKNKI